MRRGFVIGDRGLGLSGDTHPEWMVAHAVAAPYMIVGASAVGQIHQARNLPRDDSFTVRSVGPWIAVAVADGVGSRPLSRFGASYTTDALTAYLLQALCAETPDTSAVGPAPAQSKRAPLAPPGVVECAKFDPLLPDRIDHAQNQRFLLGLLPRWLQRAKAEPNREVNTAGFQMVASTGWWADSMPDGPPAQPNGGEPPAAKVATPERQPSAVMPPPDDKNLTGVVRQAFDKTHLGLREQAKNLGADLADLGCTALALALNTQTGRGALGQVGDGAILGMTAHGKMRELAHPPDTGDPQSTYTLTKPTFGNYLAVASIEPVPADPYVAYYLMTDGLSGDLLYGGEDGVLDDWGQKVGANLQAAASPSLAAQGMLNWLASYQVKGSWDDRTLVVITQLEIADAGSEPVAEQPQHTDSTDDR